MVATCKPKKHKNIDDVILQGKIKVDTQFDYLLGLEIIAKELKMDYLFRLDDDTI